MSFNKPFDLIPVSRRGPEDSEGDNRHLAWIGPGEFENKVLIWLRMPTAISGQSLLKFFRDFWIPGLQKVFPYLFDGLNHTHRTIDIPIKLKPKSKDSENPIIIATIHNRNGR
jgi:hypothetical protein